MAQLCLHTCFYLCNLFTKILAFPITYKNEWKMGKTKSATISSKQRGSHKSHLVATKLETIGCDEGSEV